MGIFNARNGTVHWGNDIQFSEAPLLDDYLELARMHNWNINRSSETGIISIKMPDARVGHETLHGTLWFKEGNWELLTMYFETSALFSALDSRCGYDSLPVMGLLKKAYHEAVLHRDLGDPKSSEMLTFYGEPTHYWRVIYEFPWCRISSCMTWPCEGYIRVTPRE